MKPAIDISTAKDANVHDADSAVGPIDQDPAASAGGEHLRRSASSERMSSISAMVVCLSAAAVLGMLLWLLHVQSTTMQTAPQIESLIKDPAILCVSEDCMTKRTLIALELHAFNLRNQRVQSALTSRLFVQVIAQVVALALIVLGGVLVFDRVRSRTSVMSFGRTQLATPGQDKPRSWSFVLVSDLPGVLLCAMGMLTLGASMYFIANAALIEVSDVPIYLENPNTYKFSSRQTEGKAKPILTAKEMKIDVENDFKDEGG
ncbi:hypothetical protein [Ahrensia sp. R2A130]|uniref:hypothetical protein n=1 Tax=Ahrensia sp. R2A130 TaxID=744979 RepID=UPI0001E0E11E|nr:hypothetical protein [Ahrensia sp. R2A130]EFL87565.1 hypothetical protein R2A130_3563 [Ahrensia sp. R2A130]